MPISEIINELLYEQDIRYSIQKTAWQCASKGSHFDALWHGLLEKMLSQRNADIKLDLWKATEIMLRCAGYYYEGDWYDTHPTRNYDLWYKYTDEKKVLLSSDLVLSSLFARKNVIAFIMTIAVFETINYRYNSPLMIKFDEESLYDCMKNGKTHIDWGSYFNLDLLRL